MNEQTLELQIKSTAEGAIKSVKLLNNSLTGTKDTVDKVSTSITKMSKAFSMGGLYIGVKKLSTTFLKWMDLAIDRTEQMNLFNVVFKNIEKNGTKTFSTLGREAVQFQNKLNETFGTNLTETTKYQALFQSMGENVGISDKYSAIMSTTMTKLTYDLASLYNKNESVVAEALRAGVYAGQTKPLRSYGIDVTQTSMQPILDSLGITDRSVKQMSQAEKEILRYLATLKQAKVAMGDFANTIESPANQLKIFKQQLVEVKVALSSLFIGAFSKILPYANAFLMVVKEVAKSIATMFGIELSDYNSGIASSEDAYDGLTDSIDGATASAKELKRQTLGFDQINNINENKDSGSGGSSVSGGIDQRLLDAIKGYDNGMEKVRMKATEIRDRIMEWLGFTKEIDPLTGEISWKLTNTDSTMGKIIYALKDIVKYGKEVVFGVLKVLKDDFDSGAFGKIFVGVFETISDLFKYIASHKEVQKIIAKIVEGFLLFKTIRTVLKPVVTLWKTFTSKIQTGAKFVQTFSKQLKGTNNYIIDSQGNLKAYNKTIEGHNNVVLNADKSVNKWQTALNGTKIALAGIATSAVGLYTVHDAIKEIAKEGPNVTNVLSGITGAIITIGGFATVGSVFGPLGTAIGVAVGSLSTLISTMTTYNGIAPKLDKETKKLYNSIDEMSKELDELGTQRKEFLSMATSEISYYGELNEELKNIVDENGNVKKGYEDRAKFIIETLSNAIGVEIDLINGQIQGYKNLVIEIDKLIEKKKAEAQLSVLEEDYKKKLDLKTEAEQQYGNIINENESKHKKYNETIKKYADALGMTVEETEKLLKSNENYTLPSHWDEEIKLSNKLGINIQDAAKEVKRLREEMKESDKKLANSKQNYENITNAIYTYEKAYEMALNGNYEALNMFLEFEAQTLGKSTQETIKYYNNKIAVNNQKLEELKNNKNKYTAEEYETEKKKYDDLNKLCEEKLELLNMISIKKIKELTPEMIDNWGEMAKRSEENFMTYFKILPNHIQTEIINKMKEKGYKIPEELQKGINAKNKPQIEVNLKTSSAKTAFDNFISSLNKKIEFNMSFNGSSSFKVKKNGGVFSNGSWHNIQQYANGGIPSHGSMFVAGEAGAELVGHINGRTEVLNQSQIASAIYNAVVSAMSQSNGQSIDLHLHTDEGVIVDRINQTTKQTGVCPINIPIN